MKQYIYSPQEARRSEWSPGTLRLEGFDVTTDPKQADIFVYPGALHEITSGAELERLPYFRGNEEKHAFFHCADHEVLYGKPCLFIRCNTRTWYYQQDPNTIAWPWPVEDFAECVDLPAGGFQYDVSFQGWYSTKTREDAAESCRKARFLKSDIAGYTDFCGYIYHEAEGVRRRKEFRRSMKESRVALCGESIPGVLPYRFLEAMSAGRVPFLISSDYVLPFADEIPYDSFILKARREDAPNAAYIVRDFLARHKDDELIRMGQMAREYWLKYLNPADNPRTMAYTVRKQFNKSGAALLCADPH